MKKFHLNNINLKNKLLIIYFFSVFIPILLTNIIFYHVTISNVKKQKEADLTLAVEHMADSFERVVNDAIGISSTLYTDKLLHDFLEKDYESIVEYVQDYDNVWRNYKYSALYNSIQNILLYTDNPTVLYAGGVRNVTESAATKEWIHDVLQSTSYMPRVIRTVDENSPETNVFSIVRILNHFHSNTKVKIVKIDLNTEMIRKAFENATFQGDVYLVNKQNEILYSTELNEIETDNRIFSEKYVSADSLLFSETYHDHYMENWQVIGVVSESVALEEAHNSRRFIFIMASINFFVPSFIIIYITSSLHVRLLRILRKMKRVKNQKFDIIEGVEYKDEIGQLTSEFNHMSKKIKDLINDVYIANIQKKDLELKSKQAQLSALQSQINPHFLFNSLETIRMRSMLKDENETAHIIKNMAKILRNSISWGKEWVRVEEEVKMLEYFLEIQQYRFGEKLSYHVQLDENVKGCMVPNMAFTPFVENASIHGVEPKLGNGFITVKIMKSQDYIVCTVTDNGVGMEQSFLKDYLHSLEADESMGDRVGIRNVYYRMKLLYGDQFSFKMVSELGKGTTVEIICPASNEMKPS
ncbi:sensor histidine kinase [Halalkalibacter sp. APA_J-10(15)]|uniref:cache domain-containing sensor histidine kinase n=1 Tax=unclassified Halalkalibacter TaxID=2893063 RepID=UPI001FF156B0|nr:sensor histidine kinase [Halalkalibacter sp. APA_J-10(15)]MCK0473145.1 sensor histidine kinase [Halalkalibacter sp. APA_J-10(15)]